MYKNCVLNECVSKERECVRENVEQKKKKKKKNQVIDVDETRRDGIWDRSRYDVGYRKKGLSFIILGSLL